MYKNNTVLLSDQDSKASIPNGFKGILYPPQLTLLHYMLNLEIKCEIALDDSVVFMSYGRISEKFSFGKTVLALALICARKDIGNRIMRVPILINDIYNNHNPIFPEIFMKFKNYIPITFIATSNNVITQWIDNINKFTDLKYMTVENVYDVKKFEILYQNNQLINFDIVIVKVGKMTSNYIVSKNNKSKTKNQSILDAICKIMEGTLISRFIIDDFDTLKLSNKDSFIHASFTWMISSTNRYIKRKKSHKLLPATSIEDFTKKNITNNLSIIIASNDDMLNGLFNTRCCPEYVDIYIKSTKIQFRSITVSGNNCVGLVKGVVSDDIIELLNSGAIHTATQKLGIHANNILDIISKIIYNVVVDDKKIYMNALSRIRENINEHKCQCCHLNINCDNPVYILSCCQIIVCEFCMFNNNKQFISRCPNCLINIIPQNLTRIITNNEILSSIEDKSSDLYLDKLLNNERLTSNDNKLNVLVQIIKDMPITCISDEQSLYSSNSLLIGNEDNPWPLNVPKKFIIYTSASESVDIVKEEFDKHNISYVVLSGSRSKKDNALEKFKNGDVNVLLISSFSNCSGIHIPYVSHIILFHKLFDLNIKSQIIARGQRYGRQYNLEVISLLYESEINL